MAICWSFASILALTLIALVAFRKPVFRRQGNACLPAHHLSQQLAVFLLQQRHNFLSLISACTTVFIPCCCFCCCFLNQLKSGRMYLCKTDATRSTMLRWRIWMILAGRSSQAVHEGSCTWRILRCCSWVLVLPKSIVAAPPIWRKSWFALAVGATIVVVHTRDPLESAAATTTRTSVVLKLPLYQELPSIEVRSKIAIL
jgi:hypothetical protein